MIVFIASVLSFACNAQQPSPDWNGTWKLNPSKGNFQSPVFTISISVDGEYSYDSGSSNFTFRCDGKDRPIENNRTRACVRSSSTALELTQKENGTKTSVTKWELSADRKVLTATATAFRPNGAVTAQYVASRTSGSNDFTGQWRDTSYLQRHADLTLKLDSQTLHIGYPNAGQYIDAPLSGVDAVVNGPHNAKGLTCAARLVGQREFLLLMKSDGKVLTEDSMELSNDGRVITYSWWNPDRSTNKATFVYEKN